MGIKKLLVFCLMALLCSCAANAFSVLKFESKRNTYVVFSGVKPGDVITVGLEGNYKSLEYNPLVRSVGSVERSWGEIEEFTSADGSFYIRLAGTGLDVSYFDGLDWGRV